MSVTCPSCAAIYDQEFDPGVFELNCVCGYSILLPTDDSASRIQTSKKKEPPNFSAAFPTALDAEDDNLMIRPDGLMDLNPLQKPLESSPGGVLGMTPSEELPAGLVYDPFELPQISAAQLPAPEIDAVVYSVNSKAQQLVTRSQLASIGNFLGASFYVKIQDVETGDLERIVIRIQKILNDRPWLEAEIKRRNIDVKKLMTQFELHSVPEILALEIYLAAFEFGGQCHFRQMP